jgi:hypothetical protein
MATYRLTRKLVLKVIGKLLTGRAAFSVTWNGERRRFEIILPANFDVAGAVPEVPPEAKVTPWTEQPNPEARAERPQLHA